MTSFVGSASTVVRIQNYGFILTPGFCILTFCLQTPGWVGQEAYSENLKLEIQPQHIATK